MSEKYCKHCGSKIIDEKFLDSDFCCFGCENAYEIIKNNGLDNYYKFKIDNPKIRNLKPEENEIVAIEEFILSHQNYHEVFLAIDGLHCAACVWLIETILKKEKNVILARINLSKKYLKLRWRGDKIDGQNFINLISKIGYKLFPFDEELLEKEEKKYNNQLVKSLAVAGFGTGNLMMISIILWFYDVDEIGVVTRNFLNYLSALIAVPTIIYSSQIFFKSAFNALKNKRSNMDIAISVAISLTCFTSFIQSFNSAQHIYFDSAIMLCFFLLIGKYLEFKAKKKSFDASKDFTFASSNYARIIDDNNNVKIINSKDVKIGMTIMVAMGEKVSNDGFLLDDEATLDNSLISGESKEQKIKKGQEILSGAINLGENIKIKVTKNQRNSLISQIKEIIEIAENHKNKYVRLADKLSYYYTPAVHLIALTAFIYWYFFNNYAISNSLLIAISVLIITCPCALALAVPIAQSLTISKLLKQSILLKSGNALEKIKNVKTIIFDKTGSLTLGSPKISKIDFLNKNLTISEQEKIIKIASSLAFKSSHPVSKAISELNQNVIFDLEISEKKGFGLESNFENKEIKLGSSKIIGEKLTKYQDKIDNDKQKCYFLFGDEIVIFYFSDILKNDAKKVIAELKKQNKEIILLSGDEKKIVQNVANSLNIEKYFYEKNPIEKTEILSQFQSENTNIIMVGDGINDSGCLAMADISISFLNASNIAQNNSDIIVQTKNLQPILDFFATSKKSLAIIKQNLFFALCYNILAVPFAFFGFITPLVAAISMSSSSLIVVLNSLRIIKK